MKTIMILAEALLKAANSESIDRLDIQYNTKDEMYHGYISIGALTFEITEEGEVKKRR